MFRFLKLAFFLNTLHAYAQSGAITGTVTTSDGKPAEFVNIVLEKTTKGTVVDAAGHYVINKVSAGTYTLTASFTGLITQRSTVTVTAGETSSVNFNLAEDNQQLHEVVASGDNRLANKEKYTG